MLVGLWYPKNCSRPSTNFFEIWIRRGCVQINTRSIRLVVSLRTSLEFSFGNVLYQLVCVFDIVNDSSSLHKFSVPNMILAFIPAQISPNTLNTMTAFAVSEIYQYGWISFPQNISMLDWRPFIRRLPSPCTPLISRRTTRRRCQACSIGRETKCFSRVCLFSQS